MGVEESKISRKVVERPGEEWKPSRVTTNSTSSVKIWGQLNGDSPRGCLRAGGGDRKRWNHLHCDCTCPPTLKTQTPRKWGILHMPVSKVNPQRSRHFRWYPDIANDFECRFGCYLQNHGHSRTHPCPWASAAQL